MLFRARTSICPARHSVPDQIDGYMKLGVSISAIPQATVVVRERGRSHYLQARLGWTRQGRLARKLYSRLYRPTILQQKLTRKPAVRLRKVKKAHLALIVNTLVSNAVRIPELLLR